jgi:hypothetical protein
LIESGPIDPKKLTDQQRALIEKIAEYSTQNGDQKQGVLGKWTDISSGFVKYAQDTNSLHYNPHPDMWNLLSGLGAENRREVAWLINKQVIQTGISKGLVFEYSFHGVPEKDVIKEADAAEAIFSGKSKEEIIAILKLDYLPIRMQELMELQKAGYKFTFDDVANSYIFVKS